MKNKSNERKTMFGEYILAIAPDNVWNNLSPCCFVTRKSKMLDRCTSLQFLIADKINCLPVTFQESHGELKWFQNNVSSHKHWDAIKTDKSYSQFTLLTQSGRVALNRSVCTLVTSSTLPVQILKGMITLQVTSNGKSRIAVNCSTWKFRKKVKSIKELAQLKETIWDWESNEWTHQEWALHHQRIPC